MNKNENENEKEINVAKRVAAEMTQDVQKRDREMSVFDKVQKLSKRLPKTIFVLGKRRLIEWCREDDEWNRHDGAYDAKIAARSAGGIVLMREDTDLEKLNRSPVRHLLADTPRDTKVTAIRNAELQLTAVFRDENGGWTIFQPIDLKPPY
jgi:hypothetical protein